MTGTAGADGVEYVQRRTARPTARDQGGLRPDDDAALSAELAAVVAGARRRAVRDGDRQVDTAHLLHSLLETDPQARALVGGAPQLARLLGYLVQRSIGYGLRWQSGVEDSGAIRVVDEQASYGGEVKDAGDWSPVAAAAMTDALRRAGQRGEPRASGTDLLAALVADPQSRAVEVLEHTGVPADGLRARLDALAVEYADGGRPTC